MLFTHEILPQFTSSNLPIIVINTNGGVIVDDEKIPADMGVIYNGEGIRNNLSDPFNHYNGKIGIEFRGSSSQQFPKKPYAIETRDSTGENLNVMLLGMPSENDWVFNAEYNDKTMMRDVLVYDMARTTGSYASRTRYFEFVLNNEYVGTYVLMEKIKQDKGRVNIKGLDPDDIDGDNLTGGYIIKVDKLDGEDNGWWTSTYPPFAGCPFPTKYQFHIPKPADIVPQQVNYIKSFITNFESVMNSPTFEDTATGYPKITDEMSFVDFFLINEVAKNVDGYRLSSFMYKDRDSKNPKLVMGPVWDFNIALGNANYYDGWLQNGWELQYLTSEPSFLNGGDQFQVPFWWKKLFESQRFKSKVKERWAELKTGALNKDRIFAKIDSLVTYLNESQIRNFQRWPILNQYVWPNYYIGNSYANEITYLKNWINGRLLWMNSAINLFTTVEDESQIPVSELMISNYPNPFNPSTTIEYSIPSDGYLKIDVFTADGRQLKTVFEGNVQSGRYNKDLNFGEINASSGVYIAVIKFVPESGPVNIKSTKLMLLK